ncbi:hypothetical protein MKZ38_007418 [Zalerion maritima]|uniref:Uncharacterized protein n=1 Tax=Zalerion maritima TaxID=339359 RepID=A0AAD5RUZ4_9PEZI|nr:hypothetical protein MKZ38_007418 [Zalerion maritima]
MTPQTRSTRGTPAEPKTYRSAPPPKQQKFASRRKNVRTYGKSRRSAPPRLLKQQTLTQMVDSDSPLSFELDDLPVLVDEEPKKKRRKTLGDSPNLLADHETGIKTATPISSFHTQTLTQFIRDKTLPVKDSDDEDDWDLIGFEESPVQPKLAGPEDVREPLEPPEIKSTIKAPGAQTPSKKTIKTEIPASTQSILSPMLDRYSPPNQRSSPSQLRSQRLPSGSTSGPARRFAPVLSERPQTPELKRIRLEIPASTESIETPIGACELMQAEAESPLAGKSSNTPKRVPVEEGRDGPPQTPTRYGLRIPAPTSSKSVSSVMLDRYSPPGSRRSPLKEKSANVSMITSGSLRQGKHYRDPTIKNPFSTKQSPDLKSAMKKTPAKNTPGKKIRFALPEDELLEQESQKGSLILGDDEGGSDVCPASPSPRPRLRAKSPPSREIPDSDAESGWGEEEEEEEEEEEREVVVVEALVDEAGEVPSLGEDVAKNTPEPEKPSKPISLEAKKTQDIYGNIGEETQAFIDSTISSAAQESSRPMPAPEKSTHASLPPLPRPTRRLKPKPIQGTQFESQRLPMDLVRQMAPNRSHHVDVFVSIHPDDVDSLADSTKNHEFRDFPFPDTVSRMWIYATKPVGELRYMAKIGPAKQPGEIANERALGNAEFNAGRGTRHAFEIIQMYELNNPVSLEDMKEEGWISTPPQRYTYVPPAVMGELVGNLRCDLFEDGELEDGADVGITISQEVEAQIRSDVENNTQTGPEHFDEEEMVPSSHKSEREVQATAAATEKVSTPQPSRELMPLPQNEAGEAVDDDEVIEETPRPNQTHSMIRPSQATTASQPSSPTQSQNISQRRSQRTMRRGVASSSLPPSDDLDGSPLRLRPEQYSYGSSELLSRSQMLPESLLMDMNPEIEDSQ